MKLATGLLLTAIAVTATFTTAGSVKLSTTNAFVNHGFTSLRRANKDTPTSKFHRQLAASDDLNMLKVKKVSDSYGTPIPLEGLLPPKCADSSNTSVAFVPNSGPTINPDELAGLGPQTPLTLSSPNSVACPPTSPTTNPDHLAGLRLNNPPNLPETPECPPSLVTSSVPKTVTADRNTLNTIDPETLYGLGPRTPLSPCPSDCPPSDCTAFTGTVPFNPTMPSTPFTPDTFQSIGPEVVPGMESYGKNEKAKQAMDEFVKQEEVICNEDCSSQVVSHVCGSDGIMYDNLCELQNASCKSPEKCITQASDPSTCNQV
ncbi:unnamed protein product [Peronospora belbahrii]|uniref:Kazal-like domain-containing protein n=1 Tax=Peronospora belbahrii TaxID=622444 RepID=A0AAU9KRH0_9STRA|nr:unnamed protein product [Peronospora belbahrii]